MRSDFPRAIQHSGISLGPLDVLPLGNTHGARAMSSPFMTVKQAANLLSLSPKTIYRAIENGDLPHHAFGRAIRISRTDLELFANKNKKGGVFSPQKSM